MTVSAGHEIELIRKDQPKFRDRTEREFAGYMDAIDFLVAKPPEPLGVALVTAASH